MTQLRGRLIVVAMLVTGMALGVVNPSTGWAQEATPVADVAMAGIPNHIHSGTCEDLSDEIVAPLADAAHRSGGMMDAMGTPEAMATPVVGVMGESTPVAVATTQVDLGLSDLLASPHAINAHDPNDLSIYIACGNIAGMPDTEGNLFIGLDEDSGSGLSGVAWLLDDGTGTGTIVTVFIVGEYESMAAPAMDEEEAATPVG